MDGFSAIPVFVTVVETGGFSPAARKLGISKSAVSKRIAQLEEHLGVQLLYRTTRRLSLTEAGERYFEDALKAVIHANHAEDSVTQLQTEPRGRLKINTPMSFGRLHIAALIPKFMQRYPKIEIDLVMDDRVVDILDGGFDIAVRAGNLPDSSLFARRLAPLRSFLCASPEYVEKHSMPVVPEELVEHNCLLFSYSASEWKFLRDGEEQVVRVSGNYQANNSEALREATLQGLGIARIPTFVAGSDVEAGRLCVVLDEYILSSLTLYAVFPERQYLPAKLRVFIDFLVEHLGGDQPYWELSTQGAK